MKLIQKNIALITLWTAILVSFLYLAFVQFNWQCVHLWLFILCLVSGVVFDFFVCEWTHFYGQTDPNKEDDPVNSSFLSTIEYHYQCYDTKWKNFLIYIGFCIYGIAVFLIIKLIIYNKTPSAIVPLNNIIGFPGLFIPYFFHKAYYFAIRIPEFKQSVYVYYENKNEIQANISQISSVGHKISHLKTIPRQFDGWLFGTKAIVTDTESNTLNKICPVPCINQSWSYKQLMDIIFYQNNQSDDFSSIYKTDWGKIKQFSGNDNLVKTCWEVRIEVGSATSGIPIEKKRIVDFSEREFTEEKINVNGLLIIDRIL